MPTQLQAQLDELQPYPGYHWEGIFSSFKEVRREGECFDSDLWVKRTKTRTEATLVSSESGSAICTTDQALLPLLVSTCSTAEARLSEISILDFGGGMGISYIHLVDSLPTRDAITYYVIERQAICETGSALFHNDPRVQFFSTLPQHLSKVDIVHTNSTLQYVEDYGGLLRQLVSYAPEYCLFIRLSAGNFPTYASAQKNVRGSVIPYWFLNLGEFVDLVTSLGYLLVFKSRSSTQCDQENFPADYRMKHPWNLLFKRK